LAHSDARPTGTCGITATVELAPPAFANPHENESPVLAILNFARALVLQLYLIRCPRLPLAVVTGTGECLVPAPPLRPREDLAGRGQPVPHQSEQQAADLRHRQRDQRRPPLDRPGGRRAARARTAVSRAWANRARVTCRYHPTHERTS